jgi:hypothetical protein
MPPDGPGGRKGEITMDANLNEAIAAKQAELDALHQQRAEQARAEALEAAKARNAEAFKTIADEVSGDPEKVGAFLVKVASESGFGLDYLVSVITGTSTIWS